MPTLDRWRWLLETPVTLEFPHLELIGRDHEPPIIVGAGEVRMESTGNISFTLRGVPSDLRRAMIEIKQQRENPYDVLAQPRLTGTDTRGIRWDGGYTIPAVHASDREWTYSGEIASLITEDVTDTVSREGGTELIFPLRVGDPMTVTLARFLRTKQPGGEFLREYTANTLNSEVRLSYEAENSVLSITASDSAELRIPYAEGWLAEPLRILFGQLIFPRLVARNFGDGRSYVRVQPCPGLIREAQWAALWRWKDEEKSDDALWTWYVQLLELIARAKDKAGQPNFEANKLTRLYEEVIQAARGSRRVWALTFAVNIEALVKMLIPKEAGPTVAELAAIDSMADYIEDAPGNGRLKQIAINAIRRTAEITTSRAMRELQATGAITKDQRAAWKSIRHSVVHGSLLSPYSNEEEDQKLLALAEMMHNLTKEILRNPNSLDAPTQNRSLMGKFNFACLLRTTFRWVRSVVARYRSWW